jgi:hypothetical protein
MGADAFACKRRGANARLRHEPDSEEANVFS